MDEGSKPRWLIGLVTASFLAMAILFQTLSADATDVALSPLAARASSRHATQANERLAGLTTRDIPAAIASRDATPEPYLLAGDDYDALVERLVPRLAIDANALLILNEAASACASAVPPGWRDRPGLKPRVRTYLVWKERFCHGRITEEERNAYSAKYIATALDRAREVGVNESEDHLDASVAYDLVFHSRHFDEIGMVSAMVEMGGDPWSFGSDLVAGTPLEANLAEYQKVAIEDILCSMTGGCGPDGMRTANLCLTNLKVVCAPGQSAADMWSEQFSPKEVDIILAIEQRIRDERARRAAVMATGAPKDPSQ
jgi:hypothetical protein